MDRITDVVWNKEAFRALVLSDKTKELVRALVTTKLQADQGTDLIRGKGSGLTILLHGGPGTGKTFTAEGVAEIAEKPLYRVTCGDVGTKPQDVEKYLESVLSLAQMWDCGKLVGALLCHHELMMKFSCPPRRSRRLLGRKRSR